MLCRVLVLVLQAWGGPVGACAGGGVDGMEGLARDVMVLARKKKWLRVGHLEWWDCPG